ncbi:unnamed protein product [Didymodactylos carnosus]|uniref:Sorting nexin-3 n=3 Tax=Didymodactylos carnosus TaxID=1234261 RepID=A0A813RMB7_9BILA|nr:unnamed protein product [Didymodactylos carnosus]CAF3567623.1 unnamed protein product [Didymodactylos carnosus]
MHNPRGLPRESPSNKPTLMRQPSMADICYTEIEVLNPETHGFGQKRYTDYEVRMKTNLPVFRLKECTTRRRYSDFEWLRKELERDSKIVVPSLPGKAWKRQLPFRRDEGLFEDDFIEDRRKGLEQFVNKYVLLIDFTMQSHMSVKHAMQSTHYNDRIANPKLEVNERRLRPIYDFMEISNYRKALDQIDRLLKKQPTFTAAKALKCLVLLKLDRRPEAKQLADELFQLASSITPVSVSASASSRTQQQQDSLVDENALTFLAQYYKELRMYEKNVLIYECACKRDQINEELLCSLFMAYVRVKDYKNQKITADRLYRLTKKIPYLNWAVISVLLQIEEDQSQLKQTLYVPMAMKMLEKLFDVEQQHISEMELLLYLYTLELKEDFKAAMDFVDKHSHQLMPIIPNDESIVSYYFMSEKRIVYNYKAKNYIETYHLAQEYIADDMDLWNWYEALFDSYFKLDYDQRSSYLTELIAFISQRIESRASGITTGDERKNSDRAPLLSQLEFGRRLFIDLNKKSTTDNNEAKKTYYETPFIQSYMNESYFSYIKDYIEQYSSKTSCLPMYDLYKYMEYLPVEQHNQLNMYLYEKHIKKLVDQQETIGGEIEQNSLSSAVDIQFLINILYCSRLCINSKYLVTHREQIISKLLEYSHLPTTSLLLQGDLVLISASILNETIRQQHSESMLIDLYCLLEYGHKQDATNFDIKLFLYYLSLKFNCFPMMKEYYEKLEIKNIQYYSLGYLLLDHTLRITTNYRSMKNFFVYLTNLLLTYTDDSWNQVMYCYKYGNFQRINEIRMFSDYYLTYSHTYVYSLIASIIVDLVHYGNTYQTIMNILKQLQNKILFKSNSIKLLFLSSDQNPTQQLQDTRDFDIWTKIDFRCLRYDLPPITLDDDDIGSFSDSILSTSNPPRKYKSSTYNDSNKKYQIKDFQKRCSLLQLRSLILNYICTLYMDKSIIEPSSIFDSELTETNDTEAPPLLPNEFMFNRLRSIHKDLDRNLLSIMAFNDEKEDYIPCELKTIIHLELHKPIPLLIDVFLIGFSFRTSNDAIEKDANKMFISAHNTTVDFGSIHKKIDEFLNQLMHTYSLLNEMMNKTQFIKHTCTSDKNDDHTKSNATFLFDFYGEKCPIELYSSYIEYSSYVYFIYLALKTSLQVLLNKNINQASKQQQKGNKKSKKKQQQSSQDDTQNTALTDNEHEQIIENLFSKLESVEHVFHQQWQQIQTTIRDYELWLKKQIQMRDEEYQKLERELDDTQTSTISVPISTSQKQQPTATSVSTKSKSQQQKSVNDSSVNDENNNNVDSTSEKITNDSTTDDGCWKYEFGKTEIKSSTLKSFGMAYMESLIQMRICLQNKQKTLNIRQQVLSS